MLPCVGSAPQPVSRRLRFAIAIPAYNEQEVIGETVATLQKLDYPPELFDIFVVADHCTDQTAAAARAQGAICYERQTDGRSSKGAALSWLFERIFQAGAYEALAIFDADTQVEPDFLRVMNSRLAGGVQAVQGRHVISNPQAGRLPKLTWAMFTIDNRLNNQGRANLGLSVRHMGDSICFRTEVLHKLSWGEGLAEDYEFRLRLLLEGIAIAYEPRAVGHGQAALTWQEARPQRLRWARGIFDASRRYRRRLLLDGLRQVDFQKIDGALNTILPSYSTLALLSLGMLVFSLAGAVFLALPGWLVLAWLALLFLLFIYPFFGLFLERAPGWAYRSILSGPVFMVWRSGINLAARLRAQKIAWVRTPHRGSDDS